MAQQTSAVPIVLACSAGSTYIFTVQDGDLDVTHRTSGIEAQLNVASNAGHQVDSAQNIANAIAT